MTSFIWRNRSNLVFYGFILTLVVILMALHGLLPNMIGGDGGSLAARYTTYGAIECSTQTGVLEIRCPLVGGSAGIVSPTNLPFITAVSLLLRFTFLNIDWAYSLIAGLIMLISLIGAYGLMRFLKMSRYVALMCSALYLYLPIILSMQGFGGTYWGLLLLPTVIFFTWKMLNLLKDAKLKKAILITIAWSFVASTLLFLDGYTFFLYASASTVLMSFWLWKKPINKSFLFTVLSFFISLISAYVTYNKIFPAAESWGGSPMGTFRAMSLDIVTLFIPNARLWWSEFFNLRFNLNLWGDGSNSGFNYIGFSLASVAIFGFIKSRKKLSRLASGLLVVGLMSFVLSLGPSLKVNAKRPPLTYPITSSSYMMPSTDAVVDLPTTLAYENLPGLKSMRATYRWHALTMLVIILFAGVGVEALLKRKKKLLSYAVLAIICVELIPAPLTTIRAGTKTKDQFNAFYKSVISPLENETNPGEKVIFYPNAIGGNDYLANYIVPELKIQSYNVGNDKAVVDAERQWPDDVRDLLRVDETGSDASIKTIEKILRSDTANLIIVPYFDLRWDSYAWPTSRPDAKQRALKTIEAVTINSNSLVVEEHEHFSIIREALN